MGQSLSLLALIAVFSSASVYAGEPGGNEGNYPIQTTTPDGNPDDGNEGNSFTQKVKVTITISAGGAEGSRTVYLPEEAIASSGGGAEGNRTLFVPVVMSASGGGESN